MCIFSGTLKCDVGIIGGGISGLYMAYKLLQEKKETSVCVFEKDSRLGGRILDYHFKEAPDIDVGKSFCSSDDFEAKSIELEGVTTTNVSSTIIGCISLGKSKNGLLLEITRILFCQKNQKSKNGFFPGYGFSAKTACHYHLEFSFGLDNSPFSFDAFRIFFLPF